GDQEPIPSPATGSTIRGRGRGRDRGRGRGRGPIAAPVEGQGCAGSCREGWTSSGSTQYYCHPVLQDTLARMLGLLEGMAQAGTLHVTSDVSQTRVGGQTPDSMGMIILIRLGVSQVVASSVPFQKVVDIAKELEMIRHEGFEQCEGKKARYDSGDYGGAPPKSQGYLG
ncbi:hypothetical protein H5410_002684, partial [Solanum commersonii]